MKDDKRFWNPYAAGVALGLVLLASFVVTGKGLGASGAITHIQAALWHAVNPTWATENGLIGSYFTPEHGPLDAWVVFLVVGVALGGLAAALSAKRPSLETMRGPRISRDVQWILALVGGIISGVAAQIARGCTSGQALTGGAQLALGSCALASASYAPSMLEGKTKSAGGPKKKKICGGCGG